MPHALQLERRLLICRISVWSSAFLVALLLYRTEFPLGWQAAAFGTLFSIIWSSVRKSTLNAPALKPAPIYTSLSDHLTVEQDTKDRITLRKVDVGMDVAVVTLLVHYTGGFSSPFAPLLFFTVYESYALLGAANASYTALIAAIASLLHLRLGQISRNAFVLYGFATSTLILTAVLISWNQMFKRHSERSSYEDSDLGEQLKRSQTATGLIRSQQVLEQQLEELEGAHLQLRSTYKEVASLHRDQKSQIDKLRASEQLLETAANATIDHGHAEGAYSQLLTGVINLMDAGGGAIWMYSESSDTLQVRSAHGRGADQLRSEIVPHVSKLSASELKSFCESQLLGQRSPTLTEEVETLPDPFSAVINSALFDTEFENTDSAVDELNSEDACEEWEYENSEKKPHVISGEKLTIQPVSVVILRESRTDGSEFGALVGVVGICEPRGAIHFNAADKERFQSMSAPLVASLNSIEQRRNLQRRMRETSLLYEMSRLVQSATDIDEVYQAVVAQVGELVTCENCTLFLLDRNHAHLEAKASEGRVVNLLNHYAFEKGKGISGWVASCGRQLVIRDLKDEPNLLNVEMIPPRIRSFVAIPLKADGRVIGVISVSHSRPNAFNTEEVQMLNVLGAQAAATIQRTEAFQAMEMLAITDGLTQCYNHRYFEIRLDDELRRSKRYNLNLSLIMVDVDNFKSINDHFGHATGDSVMQQLGSLLRKSVRDTEIVARYGGDEFALILPQTDCESALIAAERIRSKVESTRFVAADGQVNLRLTVSVGVADGVQYTNGRIGLLEGADKALYGAKRSGKNKVFRTSAATDMDITRHAVVGLAEVEQPSVRREEPALV